MECLAPNLGASSTEILFEEISKDLLTWTLTRNEVLGLPHCLTVFGAATYYSIKWVSDALDSTQKQRMNLKKRFHPDHTTRSIVYSQALRYNRICSNPSDRDKHLQDLCSFLQNCSSADHEANAMIKAQFISLWDGLESRSDCQ
ncbi:unnamed protein product, partial [Eretmochelys imbricata]